MLILIALLITLTRIKMLMNRIQMRIILEMPELRKSLIEKMVNTFGNELNLFLMNIIRNMSQVQVSRVNEIKFQPQIVLNA